MNLHDWLAYKDLHDEIERGLDLRFYSIDWLDEMIWYGRFDLHAKPGAVLVTETRTYPTGARELHGMVAAGHLPTLLKLWDAAIDATDADFAVVQSREGWGPVLKSRGFELHQVELRKELCRGVE